MIRWIGMVCILGTLLAGCQTMGERQGLGGVLGGAGGGLLGSQFGRGSGKLATTAIGVLGGALLGSEIGRGLDDVDRMRHRESTVRALEQAPSGNVTTWRNLDSGTSGAITPTRTYQRGDGSYCRKFTQDIEVGGCTESAFGTACRQPDGRWRIVG